MTIFVLLGAVQGVLLVVFLLFKKSNQTANRAAALSTLFTVVVALLIVFSNDLTQNDFQLNLRFCAWFLSFPIPVFLYFYVKFVTAENPRFIRSDWLQALPTLFAFLYVCQLFAMDYEEKRAFIEPDNLQYIIAYKTFELLQGLAVVFYSLWSFLILWRFRNKIRDEFSNLHKKQLNWLWGPIKFQFLDRVGRCCRGFDRRI